MITGTSEQTVRRAGAGDAPHVAANTVTAAGGGPDAGGLTHKAVRGVLWTYASFAGSKLLIFASTVILARLLVPEQFGQVGFALLVISYMDTVGDFGVSSALIYERERPEEAADIAFVVSLATGLLWFAAAFFAAPYVADFFNDPLVTPILRVMSAVFVINALGNTHDALLRRNLDFKKRLVPDLAMALLKGACSVALALWGWGVWSLVWGQLIGTAASTIALWAVVRWRPRGRIALGVFKRMLGYGWQIVSVNVISAVVHDADFVIVGRMLGSAALGLYSLAYRTPELFITMIIWVVGKVAFPFYSKLRDDPPALRRAFLVTLRYISLLTLPAGLGLAAVGGAFVHAFYGDNWAAAIPTLQVLAVAGALRSLGSHAGDIYKATGRPDILMKLGLLRAAVLVPALVWGAWQGGIFGVAVAQVVVTGGSTLLNLYVAGRIMSVPVSSLVREFRTAAVASAAMVAGVQLILLLTAAWPRGLSLAAAVAAGAVIYTAALWLISRETIEQAKAALSGSSGGAA